MTLKPFLEPFAGRAADVPPAWIMRQAGRYLPEYRELRTKARNFLDFCYSPELAVEATLQPIRRYGFDAAILFSDILVVPDGLGQKVAFVEGQGPVLEALEDRADIDRLDPARVVEHLAPVFETVTRLRRELPAETALIGFSGAPWTLAFYMIEGRGGVDGGKLKTFALSRPEDFQVLMTKLEDSLVEYLGQQVEAGADVLQLFDSWSGIADADLFRRFVIEPTARIVGRLKERHPKVPVIGFPRAAGAGAIAYAVETGVDGLSLDSQVPLAWARANLPDGIVLQGNLDNHRLLAGGRPLEDEVRRIKAAMVGRPFVFNLGHGVLPPTPPENVARVLAVLREGGRG